MLATTIPYYRSAYVFVSRQDRHIGVSSLADRRLTSYRIGAQVIGGDDAAVPPAEELARHGLARNLVGYSLYGHPFDNPSAQMMDAVEHGQVDMAIAWGPTAGYFAKQSSVPLRLTPICLPPSRAAIPMVFAISMGVRPGDDLMLGQLNNIIARRQKVIHALLRSYGVPLAPAAARVECR
jgi:ABC-type amino acid transport substrate-binding protein